LWDQRVGVRSRWWDVKATKIYRRAFTAFFPQTLKILVNSFSNLLIPLALFLLHCDEARPLALNLESHAKTYSLTLNYITELTLEMRFEKFSSGISRALQPPPALFKFQDGLACGELMYHLTQ